MRGKKGCKNSKQRSLLTVATLLVVRSGSRLGRRGQWVLAPQLHCVLRVEPQDTGETTNNLALFERFQNPFVATGVCDRKHCCPSSRHLCDLYR